MAGSDVEDLEAVAAACAATAAASVLADVNVVRILEAMGISGDSAVSLIATSPDDFAAVAAEVLGENFSPADLDALRRVWLASRYPGLSRRLLPSPFVPPRCSSSWWDYECGGSSVERSRGSALR